jgi:hypothetical protein
MMTVDANICRERDLLARVVKQPCKLWYRSVYLRSVIALCSAEYELYQCRWSAILHIRQADSHHQHVQTVMQAAAAAQAAEVAAVAQVAAAKVAAAKVAAELLQGCTDDDLYDSLWMDSSHLRPHQALLYSESAFCTSILYSDSALCQARTLGH